MRSGDFPPRHSRARHLLRHAAGLRGARRQGRQRPGPRVRPRQRAHHVARRPVRRRARRDGSLDEPRRPGVDASRPTSCRWPRPRTCPIAAVKHATLPVYGLQFHPEVTHTPLGTKILGNFLTKICGCTRHLAAGRFRRASRSPQIRERVGKRPRDLRPVRRRRFVGRRGAALSGDRPAALVHPGRQRPAAQRRRSIGHRRVLQPLQHRSARRQGRGQVSRGAGRRHRSAGEAPPHRPRVHRMLHRRSGQDQGRPLSGPGHALSRRDRKRRRRSTARPPRSSCTTTSAACPTELASS